MSKKYNVSIHRSSSTSYMVKRLGGAANVISCIKIDTTGNWTNYAITLKDSSLIIRFNASYMRIKPI